MPGTASLLPERDQFLALPLGILECGIKAGLFLHDLDQEIAVATITGSISGVFDDASNVNGAILAADNGWFAA